MFLVVIDVFDRDDEKNNDAAVATSCAQMQQQKEKGISRIGERRRVWHLEFHGRGTTNRERERKHFLFSYFNENDTEDDGPIPLPPKGSDLRAVLPCLLRVAFSHKGTKIRLAFALIFLVAQKAFGLAVPVYFKFAIDHLTRAAQLPVGPESLQAANMAAMMLCFSGLFKAIAGIATELRMVSFTPVAQAAGRRVALEVFNHVLNLDMQFHLQRRTGALQRIIDRGTKSVSMVFGAVIFTFIPTFVELALVSAVLWKTFSWHVVAVVLSTFLLLRAVDYAHDWGIRE